MASKLTLYVSDEAQELLNQVKEKRPESLSAIFADCLRSQLAAEKASGPSKRIVLTHFDNRLGKIRRRAFSGQWVVTDLEIDRDWGDLELDEHDYPFCYSVAVTQKGALVTHRQTAGADEDDPSNEMAINNSLQDFLADLEQPKALKQAVSERLGLDFIEELDI